MNCARDLHMELVLICPNVCVNWPAIDGRFEVCGALRLIGVHNSVISCHSQTQSAVSGVMGSSALMYICMTVYTVIGKRLHTQPSPPALGEPQFS